MEKQTKNPSWDEIVKSGRFYGVLKIRRARGHAVKLFGFLLGLSLKISIIKTKGRKETQGEPEGQVGGRASSRSDRGVVLALVFIRNYSMFSLYENASPSSTDR